MKVKSTANTERIGISFVQLAFEKMGYIFREQPISDYGIDAHIEIVKDGKATGQLIAAQIKSGKSWFDEKNEEGFVFREDMAHLEYWLNHSLPVIVVLCDLETETAYWQVVSHNNVTMTGKGWRMEIPLNQTIEEEFKKKLEELSRPPIAVTDKYTLLSLQDVSHGTAKRYSANILLSESSTKTEIYQIIREVTDDLKHREYYKNEIVKQRWKGKPAHVIFLFIYRTIDDFRTTNWICRSLWIDENLPLQFAPSRYGSHDIGDNITVDWSQRYELMQRIGKQFSRKKEDYLVELEAILKLIRIHINNAIKLTNDYNSGSLGSLAYVNEMMKLEPIITDLYTRAGNIGLAPLECKDLDERFQSLMGYAHNIVLPFSENGLKTWKEKNRQYLVDMAIKDYNKNSIRLEFELEKVR